MVVPAVGAVARRVTQNVGSGVKFSLITDEGVSGNLDMETEDVERCREFGIEAWEYGDDDVIRNLKHAARSNLNSFSRRKARAATHTLLPLGLLNVIAEYLPAVDLVSLPFCGPVLFVDRDDIVYRILCERLFPKIERTGSWHELFSKRVNTRPEGSINIGSLTYIISGTTTTYKTDNTPPLAGAWGIGIGESTKVGIFRLRDAPNPYLVIEIFVSDTEHDEKSIITSIVEDTSQMLREQYSMIEKSATVATVQPPSASQATSCKVVVIGAGNVGKSALSVQYVQETFVSDYDPNICDTYKKQDKVDTHTCFMEVVDMAGQEEYASLRSQYYRKGDGFLGVYSITDADSLEEVKRRYNEVLLERNEESAPLVLVANKCDLNSAERQVSTEIGEQTAAGMKAAFYETSAKERLNVNEAFHQLVRAVRIEKGEVPIKQQHEVRAVPLTNKESFDIIHEKVRERHLIQRNPQQQQNLIQNTCDEFYLNNRTVPPPPPPRRKRRFSKSLRKRKAKCVIM